MFNLEQILATLREITSTRPEGVVYQVTELIRCPRLTYFDRTQAVPPDHERTVRVGLVQAIGNILHDLVQSVFPEDWLKEYAFQACRGSVCVYGRADLYHPATGLLVEIKTRAFLPDHPIAHHVVQVRIYAAFLGARQIKLLYISRARGDWRVFDVSPYRNPVEIIDWALERARLLAEAVAGRKPPDPEIGPWCRGCPYRRHCPILGKKEIDFKEYPEWVERFAYSK